MVWQQCKEGNLDGLSIEGKVLFKEVNNNTNIQMNKQKKKTLTKLVAFLLILPEVVEDVKKCTIKRVGRAKEDAQKKLSRSEG
jgi:hypothetical protein